MPQRRDTDAEIYRLCDEIIGSLYSQIGVVIDAINRRAIRKRKRIESSPAYGMIERIPTQVQHLNRMVHVSDTDCIKNLRMDRNTFGRLCRLLREVGGVTDGKYVSVEEQLAIFLGILSHHKKNAIVAFDFLRSGYTVSYYVHVILSAIINCHRSFLVKPTPVLEDCVDPRWKWFKV